VGPFVCLASHLPPAACRRVCQFADSARAAAPTIHTHSRRGTAISSCKVRISLIDHQGIFNIFSTLPFINYLLDSSMFIIIIIIIIPSKNLWEKLWNILIYQDKTP
jgi:hypothetical protein